MPRSSQRWLPWIALAVAVYVVVSTLTRVAVLVHPLPHGDQWDFVQSLGHYFAGQYSFLDLWGQHNEHRIFFPRLLFFVDVLCFGGSNRFLVVTTCLLQALHVWLLVHIAGQAGGASRPALIAVAAACLFHASQLWNLFIGFQVQFVLVYLAATAAFFALSRYGETRGSRSAAPWLLACLAAAGVATGSMANGLLVWPLLVSLAVQLRLPRRTLALVGTVAVLFFVVYLWGYRTPDDEHSALQGLTQPIEFLSHLVAFLGSPSWMASSALAMIVGAVTLVAILFTIGRSLPFWRQQSPTQAVWLHVLILVLCTAGLAASGRAHLPIFEVCTSRYATPVLLAWAVLAYAFVGQGGLGVRPRSRTAVLVLLLVGLGVSQAEHRSTASSFCHEQDDAASCLQVGVCDVSALRRTHGVAPGTLLDRSEVLRHRRLSVFVDGWQFLLGTRLTDHFVVRPGTLPTSSVDACEPMPGDPTTLRASGWACDPDTGQGVAMILVVDHHWCVVGLGRGRSARPDVAALYPGVGRDIGWHTWAKNADGVSRPFQFAVLADGTAVRIQDGQQMVEDLHGSVTPGADFAPIAALDVHGNWPQLTPLPELHECPFAGVATSTWNGSDAHMGTIRTVLVVPRDANALEIPVVTGPDATGVSLRVIDPKSQQTIGYLVAPALAQRQWRVWQVRLTGLAVHPSLLLVEAEDKGVGWGQWIAIGTPLWHLATTSTGEPTAGQR